MRAPVQPVAFAAGAALGFLAGATGIGGGVLLPPLLILQLWTPAKVAGGISALFLVVNAAAGLAGSGARTLVWESFFLAAAVTGIAGARAGAHIGERRWRAPAFRRALAVVLWIAAVKLRLTGR